MIGIVGAALLVAAMFAPTSPVRSMAATAGAIFILLFWAQALTVVFG